jgi:hypothetical protein
MPREKNPIPFKPFMPPLQPYKLSSPSLFQSVKEGFGIGLGINIAKSLFGSPQSVNRPITKQEKTDEERKQEFKSCMTKYNNYEECIHHLE